MELKELKGYLGTGLMMHVDKCFTSGFGSLVLPGQKVELDSRYMHVQIDLCKPILRPLSDLAKPCLEGGKVPIHELLREFHFCANDIEVFGVDNTPNGVIEKLYEWHFDIHGLIERGEAIDINTIKQ